MTGLHVDDDLVRTIAGQALVTYLSPAHQQRRDVDQELEDLVLKTALASGPLAKLDIAGSITSATLSSSIEGASQLTMSVSDPGARLFTSGAFDRQLDGRLDGGIELELATDPLLGRYAYRLTSAGFSKAAQELTLTFEDRIVALLRSHTKRRRWKRSTTTRAEVLLAMASEVKAAAIHFVAPDLHQTKPIAVEATTTQRAQAKDPGIRKGATVSWHDPASGRVETAGPQQVRDLEEALREGERQKASNRVLTMGVMAILQESRAKRSATNGSHVGLFQQDPRYWPATRDPTTDSRPFWSALIKAARAHPTWSYAQTIEAVQGSGLPGAYAPWQADAAKIVSQFNGGLEAPGGGSAGDDVTFYRGEPGGDVEDSWQAMTRMAQEVNRRVFPVAETLYYVAEVQLLRARPEATLSIAGVEAFELDGWDVRQAVNELPVSIRLGELDLPAGSCVDVVDSGAANGRWIVARRDRSLGSTLTSLTLRQASDELPEPAAQAAVSSSSTSTTRELTVTGGAKGIVDQLFKIGAAAGGAGVYVGSGYRPGSVTSSGNVSDHAFNDANRAARDIGVRGIDLITGPPSPKLDKACAAICSALGSSYQEGTTIVRNITWQGFRIQIIWRTPDYGGHMGHVHVGARRL